MPAMPVPADGEARLGAPGPPAAPGSRQGSWPLSYLWLLGTLLRAKNMETKDLKKISSRIEKAEMFSRLKN